MLVKIATILLAGTVISMDALAMGKQPVEDEQTVNQRIQPLAKVRLADEGGGGSTTQDTENKEVTAQESEAKQGTPPAEASQTKVVQQAATQRSGEELYKMICGACHDTGVAQAPKTGDKEAWAPRIALGKAAMIKSVMGGKNSMPPKGGAADATEEEITKAVVFITNKSGANF